MSLFRNKKFLHAEMTKWNASKFAIFLDYKSFFFVLSPPCSVSLGNFFKHDPFISEKWADYHCFVHEKYNTTITGYIIDVPFSIQRRKTSNEKVPSSFSRTSDLGEKDYVPH